jgi:pilus assembly protein FimV
MKSLPQWGATVLLAAPFGAWGLGLGDIELQSALNQPFEAEIALTSATAEELEGLRASLASPETYERYGLDRPFELSSLQFRVTRNGAGRNVIRVTSPRPIVDPFLTMLVEVTWPRGRSLREYTVLLDPPLFTPEIGAEPPVRQAQTSSGQGAAAGGAIARAPQPAPSAGAGVQGSSPAPAAARAPASASPGGSYGPVRNAETLWSIATSLRPNDVTVNQMMLALYEANPTAFDGNMNLLRRGATLTVPERDRLLALTSAAATAEVRRQELSWQSSRGAPAAASVAAPAAASVAAPDSEQQAQARLRLVPAASAASEIGAGAGAGASTGASSGAAEEAFRAAAAATAEADRLRSEVDSLRGELEDSRRLLELRDEQLRDLQARLGSADAPSAEAATAASAADAAPAVTPGANLELEQLFADEEPEAGAQPAAATEGEAQAAAPAEVEPAPAVPAPAAAASSVPSVTTPAAAEPSLLSRIFDWISNPLLLISLGVGAVLLTAVWYLRHRRDDVDDVTGRWDALEADVDQEEAVREDTARLRRADFDDVVVDDERPSRTGVFDDTVTAAAGVGVAAAAADLDIDETLSSQTVINLDQADSLAEADFHMAYGLYDQAAELVVKALENEPARRDLKLKLLEVYFVWGNKDAFLDAAKDLHAEIGGQADRDWDKVLIMGKQICPDEALFDESAAGGAVDVDLQGDGSTELDFAFEDKEVEIGFDEQSGGTAELGSSTDTGLDFELAATGERIGSAADFGADDDDDLGAASHGGGAAQSSGSDFDDSLDIGERTAAGLEAALFSDDDDDEDDSAEALAAEQDPADDEPKDFAGDAFNDEDTGTATSPDFDLDGLAVTQESPTVERPRADDEDWSALSFDSPTVEEPIGHDAPTVETPIGYDTPTVETPTVETAGHEAPTVETPAPDALTMELTGPDAPTVETPGPEAPTVETPTIETPFGGTARLQMPSSDSPTSADADSGDGEHTEEIDLDDLGLNLDDLGTLADDFGAFSQADTGDSDTREQPALEIGDDVLSATGVTEVLSEDDELDHMNTEVLGEEDATMLAPGYGSADDDELAGTEILPERHATDGSGDTSLLRVLDGFGGDGSDTSSGNGLDLDLEDLAAALEGDTVEQPRSSLEADIFAGNGDTPVDIDVGLDFVGSDDPTGTEDVGALDPQTMTEIGTKLDLARAYIDMGDPEGAKSILEEVLDEGDSGQRREAQGLIDVLSA